MAFRSRDTVQLIRERLEAQAGRSLENLFDRALHQSADPVQSLRLLDGMLATSSDPTALLGQLEDDPATAGNLFHLTGTHAAIASALSRDPSTTLNLLDQSRRQGTLESDALLADGRAYQRANSEGVHLRPFKLQRLAAIILASQAGDWDAKGEIAALHRLAEALAVLAGERVWEELGQVPPMPPIADRGMVVQDVECAKSFYDHLVEALRRLEDRHHSTDPADKGAQLDSILTAIRRRIQGLPASLLGLEARHPDSRAEVLRKLGTQGSVAAHWLDSFPDSAGLYETLVENERSFLRIQTLLREGASLIPALKGSQELTERILAGEIDDRYHPDSQLRELPTSCTLNTLAQAFAAGWYGACSGWLIEPSFDLGGALSDLMDALLVHCAHRLYLDFDVIALGSYGRRELAPASDADVLFLVQDPRLQAQTNQQAEDLLALTAKLAHLGAPVRLDLRLKRDGAGSLVRTYSQFLKYELEEMHMSQRFELGMTRGVIGSEEAIAVANKAAYAQPVTPERLKELLEMKRQTETERLKPQHRGRDIKLGEGALGDLEWFVHVMEMRYPTATRAGEFVLMEDRIRALGRARLINAIEVHELLMARSHLLELRNRLELLGIQEDVLPENPAKLEALAVRLYAADANDLLLRHERLTKTVRTIYTEAMEALKVW